MWAWGENPLRTAEEHELAQAAHAAFDPLWKTGLMSRSEAYRRLAAQLGIKPKNTHMKTMSVDLLRKIPLAVSRIRMQHNGDDNVIESF